MPFYNISDRAPEDEATKMQRQAEDHIGYEEAARYDAEQAQQETSHGLSANAYVFGIAGVLKENYWNANGKGICILAVESGGVDWAAYIGADDGWSEEECVRWTVSKGCKLSIAQAHRWFPELPIEAYRE